MELYGIVVLVCVWINPGCLCTHGRIYYLFHQKCKDWLSSGAGNTENNNNYLLSLTLFGGFVRL